MSTNRAAWVARVACLTSLLGACCDQAPAERRPPEGEVESVEPASADASRTGEAATAGGSWLVVWRSGREGIEPLEPFSLEVEVRDAEGRPPADDVVVTADAAMPHHGHGMNFVPRTTTLGGGRYRVEGLLFHMRGRWEMFIDVEDDGLLERAQWTLEVE